MTCEWIIFGYFVVAVCLHVHLVVVMIVVQAVSIMTVDVSFVWILAVLIKSVCCALIQITFLILRLRQQTHLHTLIDEDSLAIWKQNKKLISVKIDPGVSWAQASTQFLSLINSKVILKSTKKSNVKIFRCSLNNFFAFLEFLEFVLAFWAFKEKHLKPASDSERLSFSHPVQKLLKCYQLEPFRPKKCLFDWKTAALQLRHKSKVVNFFYDLQKARKRWKCQVHEISWPNRKQRAVIK